ncbi:phospholipase [Riemerella anatipestifer]|uniref:phospholipase D-like domain-containing protein n=1 Tax=Riemerella anatipestifer TaxID=34085 RepID=UPI00129EF04F|nr:phospholipase D-like domain-containing protein [Riemerella anatipestifer]MRN01698.1 phospholipase [Riemerella anatipestifer]MRN03788.1 phospholipase [Riemerella anatipestifer]
MITYIKNEDHYYQVIEKALNVRRSLWIGTADIKDLYIKEGIKGTQPFLAALSKLIQRNVEVRLLFAKEPGRNFKNDFDKYPLLIEHLEKATCPRVHFKILVFDCNEVYIGSANLTGAGLGMKSERNRNFEAGILTNETELVQNAMQQFDDVWTGLHCKNCGRKNYCELPIDQMF